MSCIGPGPAERRAAKHRKHLLELGESCEACEQYAAELIDTEEWVRRTTKPPGST